MYAPNVDDSTSVANDTYVPAGWATMDASQDGNAIYLGVVKRGCRMCHASASRADIDFLQGADWSDKLDTIRSLVCGKNGMWPDGQMHRGHPMPQAEHVSKVFWATGGRALVLSYTQAHERGSNWLPAIPSFPDPFASCDP